LALSEAERSPGVVVFERRAGLDELYARPAKELQRRPLFSME
jgi:hypothetical protein